LGATLSCLSDTLPAWDIFSGFNEGEMSECIESSIHLSSACAGCFAASGKLPGWWSGRCFGYGHSMDGLLQGDGTLGRHWKFQNYSWHISLKMSYAIMQYPKIVGLVTLSSLRREIVMLDFDVDMRPPGISIPLGRPLR
jgi:hypothetical protein